MKQENASTELQRAPGRSSALNASGPKEIGKQRDRDPARAVGSWPGTDS